MDPYLLGQLGHLAEQYGLSDECRERLYDLLLEASSGGSGASMDSPFSAAPWSIGPPLVSRGDVDASVGSQETWHPDRSSTPPLTEPPSAAPLPSSALAPLGPAESAIPSMPGAQSQPEPEPISLHTPPGERYEDEGLIGTGGMGEVRRVWDRELRRTLAMKIVRADAPQRPDLQRRFVEEARVVAGLQHPGILTLHELGRLPDGRLYFTMPLVEGRTFSQVVREVHAARGPAEGRADGGWRPAPSGWTFRRLIDAFHQICEAVAYAHSRGVLHRDLKPDNVMIGAFGEVRVMDWGLSKSLDWLGAPPADGGRDPHSTRAGQVVGTPAYMPPEQAAGAVDQLGPEADVYALGAVLHQVLTGAPPYAGDTATQVLTDVRAGRPAPLPDDAPPMLRQICARAMDRDPRARHPDASFLAAEIVSWLEGARRRDEALEVVAQARELRPRLEAMRERAAALHLRAAAAIRAVPPHAPVREKRRGWSLEDEARRLDQQAERGRLEYLRALRTALNMDPDLPEAHALLADHHQAAHAAAEAARDAVAANAAEFGLRAHDRGRYADYLKGDGSLTLLTDPPGAEVRLHRYVEQDRRLVATFERRLGATPLRDAPLPMGSYLLTIQAPGGPVVRYPVRIGRLQRWRGAPPGQDDPRPVPLAPAAALGPGAIYVPPGEFLAGADDDRALPAGRRWVPGFAIQRFPVANRAYLAFLNDLLAQGREADALRWAPRANAGRAGELGAMLYGRGPDGGFALQPDAEGDLWDLDWPVLMVDWAGARAYAAWFAARDGRPWRLPTELEWEKAARGVDGRTFPWGDQLDPTFCCMRQSHAGRPLPAVVDSYPVDTSPYGVRGMAGNVKDWCLDPLASGGDAEGSKRVTRGGSWLSSERNIRLATRNSSSPTFRSDSFGIRLVCPLEPPTEGSEG